jgi:hypothetical protein
MWARIEARYRDLKLGRSQYFQMLVDWDLHFMGDTHAHKADGKWHLYPEHGQAPAREHLRAAEDPPAPSVARVRRKRR